MYKLNLLLRRLCLQNKTITNLRLNFPPYTYTHIKFQIRNASVNLFDWGTGSQRYSGLTIENYISLDFRDSAKVTMPLNAEMLFIKCLGFCLFSFSETKLFLASISTLTFSLHSLTSDMLNNTKNSNPNLVFFNRGTKVGSEAMMELILILKRFNDFEFQLDQGVETFLQLPALQAKVEQISGLDDGTVFMEHISFINFTRFDVTQPIYINLVRDPVERVISWFFYVRSAYKNAIYFRKRPNAEVKSIEWWKKDFNKCVRSGDPECVYEQYAIIDKVGDFRRQSLFFCGHSRDCLPFNSPAAIQIAKQNVEKYYAVVGSWEDTNVTLAVLEKFIPRYFHGAQLMFDIHKDKIRNRNKNNRKPKIDSDVKEMIKKNFTQEYEFYHFCKQRLYKQYMSIKLKALDLDQWRK